MDHVFASGFCSRASFLALVAIIGVNVVGLEHVTFRSDHCCEVVPVMLLLADAAMSVLL